MKASTALHLSTLTAALQYTYGDINNATRAAQTIHEAHRLAKALRARYEAACSYPWANTPAYEKRTEKMEAKLCKLLEAVGFNITQSHALDIVPVHGPNGLPLWAALQRDPRGWPLILSIGGRVESVGGEV